MVTVQTENLTVFPGLYIQNGTSTARVLEHKVREFTLPWSCPTRQTAPNTTAIFLMKAVLVFQVT